MTDGSLTATVGTHAVLQLSSPRSAGSFVAEIPVDSMLIMRATMNHPFNHR